MEADRWVREPVLFATEAVLFATGADRSMKEADRWMREPVRLVTEAVRFGRDRNRRGCRRLSQMPSRGILNV
jgi:hypothetical protein